MPITQLPSCAGSQKGGQHAQVVCASAFCSTPASKKQQHSNACHHLVRAMQAASACTVCKQLLAHQIVASQHNTAAPTMSGSAEVSAIEFQLTNGGPPVKFDQLLCTLVIDEDKGVHSIALLQKVMER